MRYNEFMISSTYKNLGFDSAVSKMYTAKTDAFLVKNTIQEIAKNSDDDTDVRNLLKKLINYNDDDSEKRISNMLRNYTQQTSNYLKEISKNLSTNKNKNDFSSFNNLTQKDYDKVGMGDYFKAQQNLKYSKALTNYMKSNLTSFVTNTFSIDV